jgi:hypothetical protein
MYLYAIVVENVSSETWEFYAPLHLEIMGHWIEKRGT